MRLAIISVTAVAALPMRYLQKDSWKDCVQLKAVPIGSSNIRPVSQVNYCHEQRRLYFRKPEDLRIVSYEINDDDEINGRHIDNRNCDFQCTFIKVTKQPKSLTLYDKDKNELASFTLTRSVSTDGMTHNGGKTIVYSKNNVKAVFSIFPKRSVMKIAFESLKGLGYGPFWVEIDASKADVVKKGDKWEAVFKFNDLNLRKKQKNVVTLVNSNGRILETFLFTPQDLPEITDMSSNNRGRLPQSTAGCDDIVGIRKSGRPRKLTAKFCIFEFSTLKITLEKPADWRGSPTIESTSAGFGDSTKMKCTDIVCRIEFLNAPIQSESTVFLLTSSSGKEKISFNYIHR